MPELSERAQASLWYDEDQGWSRIAYCLFVNNLCEAIAQLGADKPAVTARLWSIVRHHLHVYEHRHGNSASAPRVNALLAGSPFPAKTNLSNRFFQRADRASTYVPVTNPIPFASLEACMTGPKPTFLRPEQPGAPKEVPAGDWGIKGQEAPRQ
jgi:siderophore synthetase component